jgi:hypothetical protein
MFWSCGGSESIQLVEQNGQADSLNDPALALALAVALALARCSCPLTAPPAQSSLISRSFTLHSRKITLPPPSPASHYRVVARFLLCFCRFSSSSFLFFGSFLTIIPSPASAFVFSARLLPGPALT